MTACGISARIAMGLAVCVSSGVCQDPTSASLDLPAVSVYESFFRTVVQRSQIVSSPPASTSVPATIQAALGLTDQEMQSLNAIAADCESQVSAVRQSGSHLIFEARLEAIETGQTPVKAAQQLKEMDVRIGRLIEQSTQQLKSRAGPSRLPEARRLAPRRRGESVFRRPVRRETLTRSFKSRRRRPR